MLGERALSLSKQKNRLHFRFFFALSDMADLSFVWNHMSVGDRESCGQTKIHVRSTGSTSSLLWEFPLREPTSIRTVRFIAAAQPHDLLLDKSHLKCC